MKLRLIQKKFRELATEIGSLLTYEATSDLETEKSNDQRLEWASRNRSN